MLARRPLLLSTRLVLAPALAVVLAAMLALGACDFDVPPANTYVVSRVSLPSSPPEADAFGMDLDGDGEVDNRLGRALAVLSSQGIELETALASAIDRGSLILLVNIRTASFSSTDDARAEVRLGDPATAMPAACAGPGDAICRRHLDGTGTFQPKPGAPEEAALLGTIRGGTFQGGPGRVSLELALGGPLAIPFQLLGARARATGIEEAGIDRIVVAGGLTMERLHRDVIPAIRDRVQALVRASCPGTSPPGCGCSFGPSTSRALLNLFDSAPVDCSVSAEEITDHVLVRALLASDVSVDGVPCLSAGLEARAVAARF